MLVNSVTITVVGLLAVKLLVELSLSALNNRFIDQRRTHIPEYCREFISEPEYHKTIDYTLTKSKFSMLCSVFDFFITALILFYGVFPYLFQYLSSLLGNSTWGQALNFLAIQWILSLFSIPFIWWKQFRIESHFGFNRSTQITFWSDRLKSYMVSFIIGCPLIALIICFFQKFSHSWYLWTWVVLTLFQLIMIVV